MEDLKEIAKAISKLDGEKEINRFLVELLTKSEAEVLSKRWRILNMLKEGITQRQIASELNVSLCKVTRGSKILKDKNATITKLLFRKDKTK